VFDAPLDTLYVWLGLGAVSLAVAGAALALPTASPAAAVPVADAVDAVAASEYDTRAEVRVPAGAVRIGPHALAIQTDGGTAHAPFAYGPVTPVRDGSLRRVLSGRPPPAVFRNRARFRAAIERAQDRDPIWREARSSLAVRRVSWGEVDATLVG
jgi:hypothetical protein